LSLCILRFLNAFKQIALLMVDLSISRGRFMLSSLELILCGIEY
jgi:hypothetical protein